MRPACRSPLRRSPTRTIQLHRPVYTDCRGEHHWHRSSRSPLVMTVVLQAPHRATDRPCSHRHPRSSDDRRINHRTAVRANGALRVGRWWCGEAGRGGYGGKKVDVSPAGWKPFPFSLIVEQVKTTMPSIGVSPDIQSRFEYELPSFSERDVLYKNGFKQQVLAVVESVVDELLVAVAPWRR